MAVESHVGLGCDSDISHLIGLGCAISHIYMNRLVNEINYTMDNVILLVQGAMQAASLKFPTI